MKVSELPENITNIVCSFSGGKSSAMMAYLLKNVSIYKRFKLHFVFANTGKELVDTILFVRDCMWLFNIKIHLIEADVNEEKGVGTSYKIIDNYFDLSMDGSPYEEMIKKYGLPSVVKPHCTRELKIVPIAKFIKHELGLTKQNCVQAIGFRADERKRLNPKPQFIYQLEEAGTVKDDVIKFWKHSDRIRWALPLEEFEGNCDFCFKKCWSKLKQMAEKHKNRMLWWNNMENDYWVEGEAIFRGHKVILDLIDNVNHDDEDIACACGKGEDFFEIN